MSSKQLTALFLCSLVPWTVATGLLPLLPVYAIQSGASQSTAGLFLAFCYAVLALGTAAAGWLSDRFQRRKQVIVLSGVAFVPILLLMGSTANIWLGVFLCGILFFLCGVIIAMVSVLAGLFAGKDQRGSIFGILLLAAPVGAIIGGFSTGYLVDLQGFPFMFNISAVFSILGPLAGLYVQDEEVPREGHAGKAKSLFRFPGGYYYLAAASLISSIAIFIAILVRSLEMDALGFSAASVSGAAAVGSIFSIPLQPLLGRLSDRAGRFPYLVLGYTAGVLGVVVMGLSGQVWGFWLASILLTLILSIGSSIGSALVADLVPPAELGSGMSIFNSMIWVGGILGYASAGYCIQNFSTGITLITAGVIMSISVIFLFPIRGK